MAKFTSGELEFLVENEVCRLATCSRAAVPHVVPVNYVFQRGFFYIATDYGTRKLKNIRENSRVAIAVDLYAHHPRRSNRAIVIEGAAKVVERGKEFREPYQVFEKKFYWVKRDPWKEGEAPFIKISPQRKTSWGI